jgi:Cytochrome P450
MGKTSPDPQQREKISQRCLKVSSLRLWSFRLSFLSMPHPGPLLTWFLCSPDSLEFGYGSHACPGRFFATNVLKVTLAATILNYDLRLRVSEGNPVPKYNRILVLSPDRERVVEFRKRKEEEGAAKG